MVGVNIKDTIFQLQFSSDLFNEHESILSLLRSGVFKLDKLQKTYPNGVRALKGVSFDVNKGEFLVIIGLSGSGKSTMLRCLNRIHEPTGGDLQFKGKSVVSLKGRELRQYRSKIGMIFQHFNLVPRKSVLENVLTGTLSRTSIFKSVFNMYSDADRQKALELIEVVGLKGKEMHRADNLSGGQQQRVSIARALMQDPEVLLADEPVASLDPATSHSVMEYLRKIQQQYGITVICNLHFLSLVREYGTRVVALKGGEKMFEGSPSEIDEDWFKRIYGEQAVEVTIN